MNDENQDVKWLRLIASGSAFCSSDAAIANLARVALAQEARIAALEAHFDDSDAYQRLIKQVRANVAANAPERS